eukprot:PhF_6_TR13670/c0_g1_i3/m.21967/K17914/KIF13; kinesin family member 13
MSDTPRGGTSNQQQVPGTADSNLCTQGDDSISSGIQVYVRVRPFTKREIEEDSTSKSAPQPVLEVTSDARGIVLFDPSSPNVERGQFAFDYCISPFKSGVQLDHARGGGGNDSSDDEEDKAEQVQEEVHALVGVPILMASWQGFNGCVFAYGQTSSGKTYTMMGTKRDPGIIPRLCRQLFEKLEEQMESETHQGGKKVSTAVYVTYMEIYNEQVRDLLRVKPKGQPRFTSRFDQHAVDEYQNLKVRQHPLQGPFVEGITKAEVTCWLECVQLIRAGNELRAQTQTGMNDNSSRSHAIFQIIVTHTEAMGAKVRGKAVTTHRISKLNLVDLAGSERLVRSMVTGKHLTEATHINQSLSTLRKVVDALIQNTKAKNTGGKKVVIPYRESLLTWILADNFGGNSKTIMIATVSPAPSSWQETESTLRYASVARGVVNRIRVNEDPSAKLIRELQTQLRSLQEEMVQIRSGTLSGSVGDAEGSIRHVRVQELEEYIDMNHKAIEELQVREDSLRKEMLEYKTREQKLLKQQEELRRGETYWREKAQELSAESEKLKEELRQVRNGSQQEAGDPSGASIDQPIPFNTLRSTKEDRTKFWLDADAAAEAGKQTAMLKRKKKERIDGGLNASSNSVVSNSVDTPSAAAATNPSGDGSPSPPSPSTLKEKQNDHSTPPSNGGKIPVWAKPLDEGIIFSEPPQTSPPQVTRRVSEPTVSSAPTPTTAPMDSSRPISDGQIPKHGRRANGEDSTPNKYGKRNHTNVDIASPIMSPQANAAVKKEAGGIKDIHSPPVTKPKPGSDALDSFLSAPVVIMVPTRHGTNSSSKPS